MARTAIVGHDIVVRFTADAMATIGRLNDTGIPSHVASGHSSMRRWIDDTGTEECVFHLNLIAMSRAVFSIRSDVLRTHSHNTLP